MMMVIGDRGSTHWKPGKTCLSTSRGRGADSTVAEWHPCQIATSPSESSLVHRRLSRSRGSQRIQSPDKPSLKNKTIGAKGDGNRSIMRPKVVLFGDSLTQESFSEGGWGAALAHHFSRTADVVLRGYNGYNTRWALKGANRAMLGTCADGEHPLLLTVFFGANDASLPDRSSGFQHVPLDEYQRNLRSIISFFKERWPTTNIMLITPPPIDEDGRLRNPFGGNLSGLSERTNTSAGAYARACIAVATEYNIPVIDIWSKMQQFPGWEKSFLSDGLHFTAAGNGILFEEVVAKFKEMGVSIDNLPVDLPLFDKLVSYDPLKAFAS